jgi:hypothetical protein
MLLRSILLVMFLAFRIVLRTCFFGPRSDNDPQDLSTKLLKKLEVAFKWEARSLYFLAVGVPLYLIPQTNQIGLVVGITGALVIIVMVFSTSLLSFAPPLVHCNSSFPLSTVYVGHIVFGALHGALCMSDLQTITSSRTGNGRIPRNAAVDVDGPSRRHADRIDVRRAIWQCAVFLFEFRTWSPSLDQPIFEHIYLWRQHAQHLQRPERSSGLWCLEEGEGEILGSHNNSVVT